MMTQKGELCVKLFSTFRGLYQAAVHDVCMSVEGIMTVDSKCYIPRCGLVFCVMASIGFFCAFALRQSLSVAIVAMVNQTAVAEDIDTTNTSDTADQCPRDAALETEGGEFIWNRHQQAALLASFSYGHIVTQVLDSVVLGSV